MYSSFCGIDFGTTNSTIGVLNDTIAHLITVENNKTSIPTTLFFPDKKTTPLFE